jgi:DNA-binding CsgD family transcriptional regulator
MSTLKHEQRDAEIKELHNSGVPTGEIARQFGVTPGRVKQIITRDEFRANHRAALIQRYGRHPKLSSLPDETPLEVMILCDGKVQAWATRVMHLAFANPPIATLGDLRRASDTELLAVDGVGKKLVVELRRFCPVDHTATYRDPKSSNDARKALKMIRKVVETHAPQGTVPSEKWGLVKEAKALIDGILAIVRSKNGSE